MPTLDIGQKFAAFGFEVYRINGHDMKQIVETFGKIRRTSANGSPKCIIAMTHKGKGVSYMEDVAEWHSMAPNKEQYAVAMAEMEREEMN